MNRKLAMLASAMLCGALSVGVPAYLEASENATVRRELAKPAIPGGCAVFSPDGRRVAFQRERGDFYDLVVRELSTGAETVVQTGGPFRAGQPAWGPDGSLVYILSPATNTSYEAAVAKSEDGCNLWLWKDGAKRRLTWGRQRDSTPSFGPDGRIYFASASLDGRRGNPGLFVIDPADAGPRPVRKSIYSIGDLHSAGVSQPAVSPDGKLLLWAEMDGFEDVWHLCLARLSSPEKYSRITPFDMWAYAPRWSPDGRHVVFTGYRVGDRSWSVYMLDPRTCALKRLFTGEEASFSPDGRRLVYERDGGLVFTDLPADFHPNASAANAMAWDEPEKVVFSRTGMANREQLPMDESFRFGFDRTFFVRAEFDYDGDNSIYQDIVRGIYGESPRGFNLYVAKGQPHFGTRDTNNRHFRVYMGDKIKRGRGVLTGIRTADALYIHLEGDRLLSKGLGRGAIPLDKPISMVVGETFKPGSKVLKLEVGTGWPVNVPKPVDTKELFK